MSCLWYIGQAGILLEIAGAALIVFHAYSSKRSAEHLRADLDHIEEAVNTVRDEIKSQFKKQVVGFILFGAGLAMQFAGTLRMSGECNLTRRSTSDAFGAG